MALAAGITMSESRLLEENGRAHFMTRRFDRVAGNKLHMQSLCAIQHYDFNMAGAYGYEQALMTMRKMKLSRKEQLQQYRRMVFNVIARNQDDHTKNIAYLMNPQGEWSLSPAFDMTHSYKPGEGWTQTHQMSINGKRDHFTKQDLMTVAKTNDLKKAEEVIADVMAAVKQWPTFAADARVSEQKIEAVSKDHRLAIS
jgi:serine/threonine-protein kinase HipA